MDSNNFYNEEPSSSFLSDFNEAKFQIYRLHIMWLECNNHSKNGKLTQWKWVLDIIWRELAPDAYRKEKSYEEKDKYSIRINKLNEDITKAEKIRDNTSFYQSLQNKEIFLRKLQDDVGKGSKRSAIDEDDFDD